MLIPKNHDIYFEGKKYRYLNPFLTKQQQLDDTQIEILKSLHIQKATIEKNMLSLNPETDLEILKLLKKEWTQVQFLLQKNWGFEEDETFHPVHTLPHASFLN